MFHVCGGGKEQEGAAEPFLEVFFEFSADFLDAEDSSQHEAEEGYSDESQENTRARAHDWFEDSADGHDVQQEAEDIHFFCTPRSLSGRAVGSVKSLLQCIRAILRGEQYSPQKCSRRRTAGEKCGEPCMFGMAGETQFDLRFQLFGIPVRVHPIFWLSSAMMVWNGENPAESILGVLCIFVSVLIHELGHAVVIRRYGYPSEIVLYVLGGYATSAHFPFQRAIAVSLAGPFAGLGMAAVIYVSGRVVFWDLLVQFPQLSYIFTMLMFGGLTVNLLNLVPALPLDGGQVMSACLRQYGPRRSNRSELALKVSVAASATVCLWGAHCHSRSLGFFPYWLFRWLPELDAELLYRLQPDPQFLAIFMGYLCVNSLISLRRY